MESRDGIRGLKTTKLRKFLVSKKRDNNEEYGIECCNIIIYSISKIYVFFFEIDCLPLYFRGMSFQKVHKHHKDIPRHSLNTEDFHKKSQRFCI